MVAERAGASIGTVYRYFPDRVAVLHALRERSIRRFRERVADDMERTELATWWDVVDVALDACAALYRDEPGFSVVHAAPPRDRRRRFRARVRPPHGHADRGRVRSRVRRSDELRFRLGVAMELGDALINRAFERDPAGDERYLAEAKRLVHDYLAEHLGSVHIAGSRTRTNAALRRAAPAVHRVASRWEWCLA